MQDLTHFSPVSHLKRHQKLVVYIYRYTLTVTSKLIHYWKFDRPTTANGKIAFQQWNDVFSENKTLKKK